MGADRLAAAPSVKHAMSPSLWALSSPPTLAAAARRTGLIDLFTVLTSRRLSTRPQRIPTDAGFPTSISLRPARAPDHHALTVVGTSSGAVLLDGVEIARLGEEAISATYYDVSVILAVGGPGKELIVIDAEKRRVQHRHSLSAHHASPPTRIVLSRDGRRALVCSQAVVLTDIKTGEPMRRYTGSSMPVTATARFGRFFITASESKFLSVWDSDEPAAATPAKRRRTAGAVPPTATLVAPSADGVVALSIDESGTSHMSLAALLRNDSVAVWRRWEPTSVNRPVPPTFVVRAASPRTEVFVAAFAKKGVLTVLYGSSVKPETFSVNVDDASDDGVLLPVVNENVIIAGGKVDVLGASDQAKLDLVERTAALQVSNFPAVQTKRKPNGVATGMNEDNDDNKDESNVDMDDEEEEQKSDGKEDEDDADEEEEDEDEVVDDGGEPSIQQKLLAMGVKMDKPSVSANATPTLEMTRLDSRVSVLSQAIRSKDMRLLDDCLRRVQDKATIRNTVDQLPSDMAAGTLLEILVGRLDQFPARADWIVPWIRSILIEHAGALLTQQKNEALMALNTLIDSRTQALNALSRLEGRLELVMGQVDRLKRGPKSGVDVTPGAEYVEEEAEESSGEEDDDDDDDDEEVSDEEEAERMDEEAAEGAGTRIKQASKRVNVDEESEEDEGEDEDESEDESGDEDDGDEKETVTKKRPSSKGSKASEKDDKIEAGGGRKGRRVKMDVDKQSVETNGKAGGDGDESDDSDSDSDD